MKKAHPGCIIIVLGAPLQPGDSKCSPPVPSLPDAPEGFGQPGTWLELRIRRGMDLYWEDPGNSLLLFTGTDCGSAPGVVEADACQERALSLGAAREHILLDR